MLTIDNFSLDDNDKLSQNSRETRLRIKLQPRVVNSTLHQLHPYTLPVRFNYTSGKGNNRLVYIWCR